MNNKIKIIKLNYIIIEFEKKIYKTLNKKLNCIIFLNNVKKII